MSSRAGAQQASREDGASSPAKSNANLDQVVARLVTVVDKLSRKIDDLKK